MNEELIRATLDRVRSNPERWTQSSACGYRMCYAGWALIASGEWELDRDEDGYSWFKNRDGKCIRYGVGTEAARLLGLTSAQMDAIFLWHPDRNNPDGIGQLATMLTEITGLEGL